MATSRLRLFVLLPLGLAVLVSLLLVRGESCGAMTTADPGEDAASLMARTIANFKSNCRGKKEHQNEDIQGPCTDPVSFGLEDGSIPDESISASSSYTASDVSQPSSGRLNNPDEGGRATVGAWAPAVSNLNQWIQVELGEPKYVHGVLMQGRGDHSYQWVTKYFVKYKASPEASLTEVLDQNGQVQIFSGAADSSTIVEQRFHAPISASTVRICPTEWSDYIALRFELIGCK